MPSLDILCSCFMPFIAPSVVSNDQKIYDTFVLQVQYATLGLLYIDPLIIYSVNFLRLSQTVLGYNPFPAMQYLPHYLQLHFLDYPCCLSFLIYECWNSKFSCPTRILILVSVLWSLILSSSFFCSHFLQEFFTVSYHCQFSTHQFCMIVDSLV